MGVHSSVIYLLVCARGATIGQARAATHTRVTCIIDSTFAKAIQLCFYVGIVLGSFVGYAISGTHRARKAPAPCTSPGARHRILRFDVPDFLKPPISSTSSSCFLPTHTSYRNVPMRNGQPHAWINACSSRHIGQWLLTVRVCIRRSHCVTSDIPI